MKHINSNKLPTFTAMLFYKYLALFGSDMLLPWLFKMASKIATKMEKTTK
jgi:hypothetical protein